MHCNVTTRTENKKHKNRTKLAVQSSPMGPSQGMSDRARAAEASMQENIALRKYLSIELLENVND